MAAADLCASGLADLDATRGAALISEPPPQLLDGGQTGVTADPDQTRLPKPIAEPADATRAPFLPKTPATTQVGVGRVLGNRYRLEQLLGAGGMGAVYRAADLQVPGELFAVKVLKPSLRGHLELVGALREEVRKTRTLSHPNIVSAYSVNSDDDGDYMLMEYLEGETLQSLLDEEFGRGIPFDRAWPLITDMCAGLAFAHDHNVIHSDLKPSNVFVTTHGKVKLLDFGIARVARGPIRGFDPAALHAMTEMYASCEMLESDSADVRDDVYGLGCVVYEMLSGRHPFARRRTTDARDLKLQPEPLPRLTRRQNAALARALCFDRKRRIASVEEFKAQMQPTQPVGWPMLLSAGGITLAVLLLAAAVSRHGVDGLLARLTTTGPALASVQLLAHRAAALGVDSRDSLARAGFGALDDAQARLKVGANAEAQPYLEKAAESLKSAARLGARMTAVGSTAEEIDAAVRLCRRETGNDPDCTAASLTDERARQVSLRPFTLDTAPATNGEFASFVRETGYLTAAERAKGLYAAAEQPVFLSGTTWQTLRDQQLPQGGNPADFPVRGIDYASAKAYCAWRGKRLPSEDEWEYAARGPARQIFPWGNRVEDAPGPALQQLRPVSSLKSTGYFGSLGQGGLVWEWTEGALDSRPILRGASFLVNLAFYRRLAMRERESPLHARVDTGIRCAVSSTAWPDAAGSGAKIPSEAP
jgi:formylglycine-generating enzyme required for sulfatase activity